METIHLLLVGILSTFALIYGAAWAIRKRIGGIRFADAQLPGFQTDLWAD